MFFQKFRGEVCDGAEPFLIFQIIDAVAENLLQYSHDSMTAFVNERANDILFHFLLLAQHGEHLLSDGQFTRVPNR